MIDGPAFAAGRSSRDIRILARMLTLAENDPRRAYEVLAAARLEETPGHTGNAGRDQATPGGTPNAGRPQETPGDTANSTRDHATPGDIAGAARPPATVGVSGSPGSGAHPARVVGFTGPPGVGKSSLVNALVERIRSRNQTVAVLAVDPSSPFRGGALLGDRIRMNAHASDPGVYIRSMATRGVLGGLTRAAWICVRVLETWGFDWVFIETAGVGQNEIDVVDLADVTALVLSPAAGDDVQVMKAGIMEAADLFVINKADLPGAERLRNSLSTMLSATGDDAPGIFTTIANGPADDNGVGTLLEGLDSRLAAAGEAAGTFGEGVAESARRRRLTEVRRTAVAILTKVVDGELEQNGEDATGTPNGDPMAEAEMIVGRVAERITARRGQQHQPEE